MFLRATTRRKDGKEHHYWSMVENRRLSDGRVLQRHVLYLGEINASQELAWRKSIEVFEDGAKVPRTLALFPEDRCEGVVPDAAVVRLRLRELRLCRPRQWGACWLALWLWQELRLDEFWGKRLLPSRKGTRWDQVLFVLVAYRLLAPGSEWRLHREWLSAAPWRICSVRMRRCAIFTRSIGVTTGCSTTSARCLITWWIGGGTVPFDVLLYDLTSTYFECDPPPADDAKRRFGHSRDRRSDCVQVVIALVVTPEGLPLAYEVLAGNTADNTTLRDFLARIERQYGRARRIWAMDRGIPTEAVLTEMRESDPPVHYLVGTPKGRLSRFEKTLLAQSWQEARPGVDVKLLPQDGELYVYAQSRDRVAKERAIRRRKLKRLWARLKQLSAMTLTREALLMKLGAARQKAPSAWRLVEVKLAEKGATFRYRLRRDKLRQARRREGRYLLRTNLTETDPAKLWHFYLQLVAVEEAFKNLKGDLAIRPIFHQLDRRIEAHIFIAFLAYCLHVTLSRRLHPLAPGLTPRSVIEKFAAVQMLDVHIPTTDGRELVLTRYTQPEPELTLLLQKLALDLPAQPPPKITAQPVLSHRL